MSEQSVAIGKKVPDFSAEAISGRFSLAAHKGKILIFYFYPRDNTPTCTEQSIQFRELDETFRKAGAIIVGVNRDSIRSHEEFAKKYALPFPLISDTDESICNLFGVIKTKKNYGRLVRGIERSTFLIDQSGKLIQEWRGVRVDGHVDEVLDAVKKLTT